MKKPIEDKASTSTASQNKTTRKYQNKNCLEIATELGDKNFKRLRSPHEPKTTENQMSELVSFSHFI